MSEEPDRYQKVVVKTICHMHYRVRTFLKFTPAEFRSRCKGLFTNDDGTPATRDQVLEFLMDELKKGHELLPVGECDNFDYESKGCLGHKEEISIEGAPEP